MAIAQIIQNKLTTTAALLYMAFELSNSKWKIRFSDGVKFRNRTIEAGDLVSLGDEIQNAIEKFKLAEDVEIHSCYEAGRDGFWLHRYLEDLGIDNLVVDSSSIQVDRRARKAKTDRLDVEKLMVMLIRHIGGEQKVWRVVQAPTPEQEDLRRMNRERERLLKERTQHANRLKSLLVTCGVKMKKIGRGFLEEIETLTMWNGEKLDAHLKSELSREYERYLMVQEQMKALEEERREFEEGDSEQAKQIEELQRLKGIGETSAFILTIEFFWREFNNVKQVGSAAGLVPTPFASGDLNHEQGISKAGSWRVRTKMVELSWCWLRYQPESALSKWFKERFGSGGKRMRRIGIVALARKLLIALWKYLEKGIVPEGAQLKRPA